LRAKLKGEGNDGVSILINGRGEFENMAPLASFTVDKGENHIFRLIEVGSADTFLVSVPGLRLIVKETDGYEFKKQTVDRIIIYPAERYDFELDLRYASEGIYNITAHIIHDSDLRVRDEPVGIGHIRVTNERSLPVTTLNRNTEVILNCPFQVYPPYPNFTCLPVSELTSNSPDDGSEFGLSQVLKTEDTYTHFLNFGFAGGPSINGRKFIWPEVSALSQPSEVDTACVGCGDETTCSCSHSLDLPSGSENIMILSNLGTGRFISHPVHMHGHTYEVLKMGFPSFSSGVLIPNEDIQCSESRPNNASQCNNAKWRNPVWNDYTKIPGINLIDPVRKDTVVVPNGGYTIIRIRARNPGVWFMHCHIDPHMISGMAMMLNESFEKVPDLPNGLPTCHSFTNRGSVNELQQLQQEQTSADSKSLQLHTCTETS
jgi:FtsP/CotA-like multicopper oxidase with cupredoxin domain